jgi:phage terminase large subunit-like protein
MIPTDEGSLQLQAEARNWIFNEADKRAVEAGMGFSLKWANETCDWIEEHCCLYEGERAGQPLILYPAQREFVSRLFGWVMWSDEWNQWIRRFNRAGLWKAKKNGKSPLLAAIGLRLLCGDGEQGQKVYTMAKNGQQAGIAQKHAVMMVKQSPKLFVERGGDCKIHNSTLQITHLPTNSVMVVLTGDDTRGAKSKEGLNGSGIIDEVHVVDREMMERTSRMGISRKEPLILSASTAGDDPSSYGFERFEYGRQVNKGERHDLRFLHAEYCAPDNVSDADIDEKLEEYGKAANPAWNAIVKPSEFRDDWTNSKGKPREVARFKQYRLNLWVGSTNQWLDTAGWAKGKRTFSLADLAGRDCFAALDLSRTRDLTAFVLMFPWPEDGEEVVRVWPMFWMPEETARERDHLFPFRSWATGGFINLTKGAMVDYNVVKADIRAAIGEHRLNVLKLVYDEHYANELTQALHEGEEIGKARVPGVVAEREAFGQSLMYFTGPCKELERRISAGLVQHPDNKVLSWQVGHCETWNDRNQNIRPVKPAPHSGKSIDGVVCMCMEIKEVMALKPDESCVYDTRMPLII